jgi:hypothetical protein
LRLSLTIIKPHVAELNRLWGPWAQELELPPTALASPERPQALPCAQPPDQGTSSSSALVVGSTANATTSELPVPRWDEDRRQLWYAGTLVKGYARNPAKNQIDIIEAFHRAGWCPQVDDPFGDARKLNQTLYDLNKSLAPGTLRFRADGTGEGVVWEPALSKKR